MKVLTIMSFLSVFLTAACSQVGIMAANTPTYFSDTRVIKDVAFGKHKEDFLDIYIPSNASKENPLPVVVFYYGGRWEDGTRGQYRFVGEALAKRNFIAVIPDYRKYPDVKFPAFVEDSAKSLAWTMDHIGSYGGDASQISVMGHSSGAHLASLIITDKKYLAEYKKNPKDIHSFVGLSGPYAFTPEEPDLKDMFGPESNYPNIRTTTFVDGTQPPMLLLWGKDDTIVGAFNHEKLAAAIHDKGGVACIKTYESVDHVWIIGALTWLGMGKPDILGDATAFFKSPVCPK